MLVLSRKVDEKIQIGDHITVTVVRLGPNSVRLGIEAPPGAVIARQELLDALSATAKDAQPNQVSVSSRT